VVLEEKKFAHVPPAFASNGRRADASALAGFVFESADLPLIFTLKKIAAVIATVI
jgi:hypothetical protein